MVGPTKVFVRISLEGTLTTENYLPADLLFHQETIHTPLTGILRLFFIARVGLGVSLGDVLYNCTVFEHLEKRFSVRLAPRK